MPSDSGAGDDRTVITIGYIGDPKKNRGLEQAVRMLQELHPDAEIVTERMDPLPACNSAAPPTKKE